MSFPKLILSLVSLLTVALFSTNSWSCTGLQLKAKDGAYINGRTVEFGAPILISGMVVPRNYEFKGTLPDGSAGLVYKAKYAAIGGTTYDTPALVDGLNEKGLSAAAFYFPDYASYATITDQNKNHALSPVEFTNWLLTQFANVDEVRGGLKSVVIAPTSPSGWAGVPPFHYIVYDKSGKSIVIEPINGQLKVSNNPIGVFTNSPTFDWQITNLSNYINLSPINAPAKTIDGLKLKQFGQGSGLHGLPGDFTPPSRFVRAALFATIASSPATADKAVLKLFHILNQFDIPVGAVKSVNQGDVSVDYTLATTVKDPKNLKYYFRTYDDQTIKVINMNALDLNANNLKMIAMQGSQPIVDVTATATTQTPTSPTPTPAPTSAPTPTSTLAPTSNQTAGATTAPVTATQTTTESPEAASVAPLQPAPGQ